MKNISIALLLVTVVMVISCKKEDIKPLLGSELTINFDDQITLSDGKSDINIKFTGVNEDSRCPMNATCIWAGRAVVGLTVNSETNIILGIGDLDTGTTEPYVNTIDFDNYNITLLDVINESDLETSDTLDYKIVIKIDKVQ